VYFFISVGQNRYGSTAVDRKIGLSHKVFVARIALHPFLNVEFTYWRSQCAINLSLSRVYTPLLDNRIMTVLSHLIREIE
jgi:hypothetical protein